MGGRDLALCAPPALRKSSMSRAICASMTCTRQPKKQTMHALKKQPQSRLQPTPRTSVPVNGRLSFASF